MAVERLFVQLIRPGAGQPDTLLCLGWPALAQDIGGADLEAARDAFVAARLLKVSNDPQTRELRVEIAHEALIDAWPRLRSWLNASRTRRQDGSVVARQQRVPLPAAAAILALFILMAVVLVTDLLDGRAGQGDVTPVPGTLIAMATSGDGTQPSDNTPSSSGLPDAPPPPPGPEGDTPTPAFDDAPTPEAASTLVDTIQRRSLDDDSTAESLRLVQIADDVWKAGDTELALLLAVAAVEQEEPAEEAIEILAEMLDMLPPADAPLPAIKALLTAAEERLSRRLTCAERERFDVAPLCQGE